MVLTGCLNGLAENPFGWMRVNGAAETKGSVASALFPRHLLHHQEQTTWDGARCDAQGSGAARESLSSLFLSLPSPE